MNAVATPEQRHEIIAKALEQILEGQSISEIANTTGINRSTLHSWLLGEVPEKYRGIQQQGLIARIVHADNDIDDAKSHLDVARAREKARFTRWDAERRLKSLFAPSQELSGPGGGPIIIDNLERARRYAFLQSQIEREPIDVEAVAVQHEERSPTELSTDSGAGSAA